MLQDVFFLSVCLTSATREQYKRWKVAKMKDPTLKGRQGTGCFNVCRKICAYNLTSKFEELEIK
jgi:hypothetical protein